MDGKYRVIKTSTRKRQPPKTKRTTPIRRSARLQQRFAQEKKAQDTQLQPSTVAKPSAQKREQPGQRGQPAEESQQPSQRDQPAEKSQRPSSNTAESAHDDESVDSFDAIDYWRKHLDWPKWYSKADATMTSREQRARPRTIKPTSKSSTAQHVEPTYECALERNHIFFSRDHKVFKLPIEVKQQYRGFFLSDEPEPQNTLFDSDIIAEVCRLCRVGNHARMIRTITELLVPSAVILTIRRRREERIFKETTDELWTHVIPMALPLPQPDYGVGFCGLNAFSEDERKRLRKFVGIFNQQSYFKCVPYMYFPFLICEATAKWGLDVVDRKGAHAAAIMVRGVVELFRLVKREKELDCQVLAFSVSHDDCCVRIYAWYPSIDGEKTQYYRWLIDVIFFGSGRDKRRWDTYNFTRNIYDKWAPDHLKRIRSAIDLIPDDTTSSSGSETPSSEDMEEYEC